MPHYTTLLTLTLLSLSPLTTLAATVYTGEGTFYSPSVGLGSCGHQNQDTDHVAALAATSMQIYNPSNPNNNPLCGHKVKVWNKAKPSATVTVSIMDTCPGCKGKFDLDLSPAAFNKLVDPKVGRIQIAWEFVEPAKVKKGPFAGAAPGKKVTVNQKVLSNKEVDESRGSDEVQLPGMKAGDKPQCRDHVLYI